MHLSNPDLKENGILEINTCPLTNPSPIIKKGIEKSLN